MAHHHEPDDKRVIACVHPLCTLVLQERRERDWTETTVDLRREDRDGRGHWDLLDSFPLLFLFFYYSLIPTIF